jgi:tRNA pseudouridine38-40 synthase
MRYRMVVAYDGTDFHGWQKQVHPERRYLRTVQDVLEKAVVKVMRQPVILTGASRTDAGVHAKGQVVTFDATNEIPPDKLVLGFNSWLPDDVQIRNVDIVHSKFNPINHCTSKGYRYMLAHGCSNPLRKPLFDRRYTAFTAYALDVAKMKEAASHFLGEHDFAGFTKLNHGRKTTVRIVDQCEVSSTEDWRIAIDIAGTGFLWNMVRIMAGTLLEVGRGYITPEDIPEIIASCDRKRAGKTMAAQGLSLEWVAFENQSPNKLAISKNPCSEK